MPNHLGKDPECAGDFLLAKHKSEVMKRSICTLILQQQVLCKQQSHTFQTRSAVEKTHENKEEEKIPS